MLYILKQLINRILPVLLIKNNYFLYKHPSLFQFFKKYYSYKKKKNKDILIKKVNKYRHVSTLIFSFLLLKCF